MPPVSEDEEEEERHFPLDALCVGSDFVRLSVLRSITITDTCTIHVHAWMYNMILYAMTLTVMPRKHTSVVRLRSLVFFRHGENTITHTYLYICT